MRPARTWRKRGLAAAAAAAVVVLVTGVVLLAWGAATLIRAIPGWWRLLAVPTALVAAVVRAAAADRGGQRDQPSARTAGTGTPARYGLGYQDVAFRTADGVRLSAWYIPPRNGAAVVLLPGAGSTRTAVLGQAAVLARHGYGALLVDTRGHGRSGGHAMDFGWWGDRDLAGAVSFLDRQSGVRAGKIAVLGESMGGEQALAAAGSDPGIRAVVAEGATGQQLADRGWLPGGTDGALQRGMEWVMYTAAGLISGAPRPMSIPDAIRAADGRPDADHRRRGRRRRAGRGPLVPGRLARHRAGVGGAARRAHPGPGHRAPGLGGSRDRLPGRRARALSSRRTPAVSTDQVKPHAAANEVFSPSQEDYDHAELILDAYDWCTSEAGGKKGSAMLGDEMIDEASRKMALVIAGKGRAAGMQRTSKFEAPEA